MRNFTTKIVQRSRKSNATTSQLKFTTPNYVNTISDVVYN